MEEKSLFARIKNNKFVTIVIIVLLGVIAYLSLRINQLTQSEPATAEVVAKKAITVDEDSLIADFLTTMINENKYYEDTFLESHCTKKLLAKLQADYEYDTPTPAYASWDFRGGAQESKPGGEDNGMKYVFPIGNGWYLYIMSDAGWFVVNKVKAFVQDNVVMMDDVANVYDEIGSYYHSDEDGDF